eukprot:SAG22_NODE_5360_length_1028_cov_1.683531_1_plen_249_part_01
MPSVDDYDWGASKSRPSTTQQPAAAPGDHAAADARVSELSAAGNKLADKKKWAEAEKLYTEALDVFGLGAVDTSSLPSRRTLETIMTPQGRLMVLNLYCNRATAFLAQNRRPLAVADTRRACETDVHSPTARFKLGFAQQWSGRYDDAVMAYQACIDLAARNSSESDDQGKAKLEMARLQAQGFGVAARKPDSSGGVSPGGVGPGGVGPAGASPGARGGGGAGGEDSLSRGDESAEGAQSDRVATEVSF